MMQLRAAMALLLFAGFCGEGHAAILKSQADGFLSAKGSHEPEPEPEPRLEHIEHEDCTGTYDLWPHQPSKKNKDWAEYTVEGDDEIEKVLAKERIQRTEITSEAELECVCPLGEFWHFRIKKCVKQGGWGYECGFFPKEHWKNVCEDGLTCRAAGAAAKTDYGSHGAQTATCVPCAAEDKCLKGEERRKTGCLKNHIMHGKSCFKTAITVVVGGKAIAHENAVATMNAAVNDTVAVKATAVAKADAQTSTEVEKTRTAKATAKIAHMNGPRATATATRTAVGTATAEATVERTATHTAEATASIRSQADAHGEGRGSVSGLDGTGFGEACVTADEARELLGLSKGQRVGPFWAAKIISKGDQVASARAHDIALKNAEMGGKLRTLGVARAEAKADAVANAMLEAEAKAREAAARQAERCASGVAKEVAESTAWEKAKVAAKQDASTKSKKKAETLATAEAIDKATDKAEKAAQLKADAKQARNEAEVAQERAEKLAKQARHEADVANKRAEQLEAKAAKMP